MSCNCQESNQSPCCSQSTISPCAICAENTAANETLPSALDNFIKNFFGTLQKTEIDGVVTWILPCDLAEGLQNNPRVDDEGLACYFLRLFKDGIVGLTGPRGFKGDAGTDGASGIGRSTAPFTQLSLPCPDIILPVDNVLIYVAGGFVLIPGSGYYEIMQVIGDQIQLRLISEAVSPDPVIPAGTIVIPVGSQGVAGPQGNPGSNGTNGTQGQQGVPGVIGPSGVSAWTVTTSSFPTMPAIGADTGLIDLQLALGSQLGQYVWVEGAGYMEVVGTGSATQIALRNTGADGNTAGGVGVGSGKRVFITAPPSPADLTTFTWKLRVRVCADTNQALTGATPTIDGIVLSLGDRVLLVNQTNGKQNGVYETGVPWARVADASSGATLKPGVVFNVTQGDAYAATQWTMLETSPPYSFNTTNISIAQVTAGPVAHGEVNFWSVSSGTVMAVALNNVSYSQLNGSNVNWDVPEVHGLTELDDFGDPVPGFVALVGGYYLINWSVNFRVVFNGDVIRFALFKDVGAGFLPTNRASAEGIPADTAHALTLSASTVLKVDAGDAVSLMGLNNTATRNITIMNGTFTVHRIR